MKNINLSIIVLPKNGFDEKYLTGPFNDIIVMARGLK